MMTVYLLTMAGHKHELQPGKKYKLGREPECQVELNDDSCSRVHAELTIDADGSYVFLKDLDSRNGTYVNERRIRGGSVLHDLDRLRFGTMTLVFRQNESSAGAKHIGDETKTINQDAGDTIFNAIESSRNKADIAGRLESIALVDLLQLLHQHKRTGKLQLTVDNFESDIVLIDGSITSASYRGVNGMPALFALVLKREGVFYFRQQEVKDVDPSVTHTTPQILFELCRVLDEVDQAT